MRQLLLLTASAVAVSAALTACGRPGPADKGAASAASASTPASAAKPSTVLLLAPEDLLTLRSSLVATGPVISGALQPERRADLRAELAAIVLKAMPGQTAPDFPGQFEDATP